jgi:uncharacterized protein (TIGR02594 family)
MTLPKQYAWLEKEPDPKLLIEMRALHGTVERRGSGSNPEILRWAKEIGLGHVYKDDAIAWCGLTVAFAAFKAGYPCAPKGNALWARNWACWGNPVDIKNAMLGDVLVFVRKGGGHVGVYVAEDADAFHVLGGNQGDAVNIKRIVKSRCIAVRRSPFKRGQPASVRKVVMAANGSVSKNEA